MKLLCLALVSGFALHAPASAAEEWRKVELPGPVRKVSHGATHTLFLLRDGSIFCTGLNDHGQCSIPPGLPPCTDVAAGLGISYAVAAGKVVAWGLNPPAPIPELAGQEVRNIAVCAWLGVGAALLSNGDLFSLGGGPKIGRVDAMSGVELHDGMQGLAAINSKGAVTVFKPAGKGMPHQKTNFRNIRSIAFSETGLDLNSESYLSIKDAGDLIWTISTPPELRTCRLASRTFWNVLFWKPDGTLFRYRQLVDDAPVPISKFTAGQIRHMQGGMSFHTLITEAGDVYVNGADNCGQLPGPSLGTPVDISVGGPCAVLGSAGIPVVWGDHSEISPLHDVERDLRGNVLVHGDQLVNRGNHSLDEEIHEIVGSKIFWHDREEPVWESPGGSDIVQSVQTRSYLVFLTKAGGMFYDCWNDPDLHVFREFPFARAVSFSATDGGLLVMDDRCRVWWLERTDDDLEKCTWKPLDEEGDASDAKLGDGYAVILKKDGTLRFKDLLTEPAEPAEWRNALKALVLAGTEKAARISVHKQRILYTTPGGAVHLIQASGRQQLAPGGTPLKAIDLHYQRAGTLSERGDVRIWNLSEDGSVNDGGTGPVRLKWEVK